MICMELGEEGMSDSIIKSANQVLTPTADPYSAIDIKRAIANDVKEVKYD